jgi:hypothetical protein
MPMPVKKINIVSLAPAIAPVFQADISLFFSHAGTSKDDFSAGI